HERWTHYQLTPSIGAPLGMAVIGWVGFSNQQPNGRTMDTNNWQGHVLAFCRLILFSVFKTILLFCRQAHAQQCDFYPIALSAQQLSNAAPGAVLNDIY